MKKYFSIISSVVLCFILFFSFGNIKIQTAHAASPAIVQSGTLQGVDINYTLDENGLLTISGTDVIPNDYDGTDLEWAQWKNDITSIVIENGITGVGYTSFFDYTSLTKVTLADSVQSIDQSAFANCISLTEINFPNTMTIIRSGAFSNCSSLESIELPNGITRLGSGLFKDCINLTNLIIPNSVEEFSSNVFFGCTSLKNLTLPKNLTTIDKEYSFNGSSFEKIYVPCEFSDEFDPSEYAVSYADGNVYLDDTGVEILELHDFDAWEDAGNGKIKRECVCGHVEISDAMGNLENGSNNDLNGNKTNTKSKSKNNVSFGTAFAVVGSIFVLAIAMVWFANRANHRKYH